jgi:co-chaperonin GroES (HSP10)
MKIKPLFDRVLCKPVIERTSQGGIYIPTTNAERHQIMTVVEVGAASPVSIGEKIIINKYAGAEIALNNEKLYLVQNLDIIGVIYE